MSDLKQILPRVATSIHFDNDEIDELARIAQLIQYEEGDILFEAGDPGDSVFLVGSGAVDLYTIVGGDLEETLLSVREGGFVGVVAAIEEGVRDINARAGEKAEVYKFERDDLSKFLSEGSQLGLKLLRMIAEIAVTRSRTVLASLRQNLEWTLQVSGLAALDISQLIVDQANIRIELVNGKHLTGTLMKAEERPHGYEIFIKTADGTLHFIPYHAIVSASFRSSEIGGDTARIKGM